MQPRERYDFVPGQMGELQRNGATRVHTPTGYGGRERERERDREGLTHAITAAEKPLDAWAGGRGRRRRDSAGEKT